MMQLRDPTRLRLARLMSRRATVSSASSTRPVCSGSSVTQSTTEGHCDGQRDVAVARFVEFVEGALLPAIPLRRWQQAHCMLASTMMAMMAQRTRMASSDIGNDRNTHVSQAKKVCLIRWLECICCAFSNMCAFPNMCTAHQTIIFLLGSEMLETSNRALTLGSR